MNEKEILTRLRDSVVNFDIDGIKEACKAALEAGISPQRAIIDGMAKGMDIVGQLYEDDEYFLPELIMAAEAMNEGVFMLKPYIKTENVQDIGTVVLGTVQGDIHDVGKNIVGNFLTAAGFDVYDLGVDVSAEEFVKAAKEKRADIVGMSALMTSTMKNMKDVIKGLKEAGIRDKVKIIIGGAPVSTEYAVKIGANGYANDAIVSVEVARGMVRKIIS